MIKPPASSRVRIFLPTFRRPHLLPRAVESLRAQTFEDWVCEIHNDDPEDAGPGQLLIELGDPRFVLINHERNLGGTEVFNRVFQSTPEPFYSLLEDDNWWEPDFLTRMIATAELHPNATVFWANMRIWEELPDGTFRNTGQTVRQETQEGIPQAFSWGAEEQLFGALHSHGAALFRSQPAHAFTTPDVPIAVVEMFRERLFPYPLIFVPHPLANFSLTRQTARSQDRSEWAMLQSLLAASFLKQANYDRWQLSRLWEKARAQHPPMTTALLLASFLVSNGPELRQPARFADWLILIRGFFRNPRTLWRVLRATRDHSDWWQWLNEQTSNRFREARSLKQ